ncbi:hypothetical protein DFH09DRAFT_629675 [Mycena vulgaris]|nr:hypothetical protein DFH09DRAFT_629675 [Mycena vulgaris]
MSTVDSGDSAESEMTNLRRNVVPEPMDCIAIQKSIAEAEDLLSMRRLRISETSPTEDPELQCNEIQKFVAISSSRLAPVRRLVPELLAMIFLQTIQHATFAIGRRKFFAEYAFAAVSFHWRAIALSTPSLWAAFSVSLRGANGALQMLQLYLRRSTGFPLKIEVRKDPLSRSPFNTEIVDQLVQNSDRWLRISLPLDTQVLPLFSGIRGRLPSLETVSFSFPSNDVWAATDNPLEDVVIFEDAPKLCNLSIRNASAAALPRIPLEQIERVMLTNTTDSVQLLRDSLNLRKLALHSFDPHPSHSLLPEQTPFVLPRLSAIDLTGSHDILHCLAAPSLESLSINEVPDFSGPIFASFIERSCESIRILNLTNVGIRGRSLVHVLRGTPALETLAISDARPHSFTETAMEALVINHNRPVVVPALQELRIYGSYLFRTTTLLDVLESRTLPHASTGTATLRVVHLRLDQRKFREDELERFRRLEGVALSLERMDAQRVCIRVV